MSYLLQALTATILAAGCTFWAAYAWWKFQKESEREDKPAPQIHVTQSTFELPTFIESPSKVSVSLGEQGYTRIWDASELKESTPLQLPTTQELGHARIEDGKFYFDAKIFYSKEVPPIEIKSNQISGRPTNWDINSNKRAFEIVNESHLPVLQYYFKGPFHIVINGMFMTESHIYIVDDSGVKSRAIVAAELPGLPPLPKQLNARRIFKYPSWKYPGQIEEP